MRNNETEEKKKNLINISIDVKALNQSNIFDTPKISDSEKNNNIILITKESINDYNELVDKESINENINISEDNLKNTQNIVLEDKNKKINKILEISNEEYIPKFIGKLCFDPITLFIYDTKNNSFYPQKYENMFLDFDKLNMTSSCCNGDNKLFISGGIVNNDEIVDKLWIFDLMDYSVDDPIKIYPKNDHSMIYIPNQYIFILGGNDEKTFYYNIKDKNIYNLNNLNIKRIEPALIQVNNYLYAFDNVNKNKGVHDFEITFEKTNLLSNKPNWELIKPKLSTNIIGTKIIQKFFGVAKESDESIIFLGGNVMDEYDNIKNYRYNIKKEIIEFSDVPFINFQLKEKKFLTFNRKNDVYFILPDFYKKHPQVVFYAKNKNIVKVIDYKQNIKNTSKKLFDINYGLNSIKSKFNLKKNYNFNMPKNLKIK